MAGGGSWFLWTHGSCVATYCPLGLSLWHCLFWSDVHGLPQLSVDTSVLGGLSSLSPGYGPFHRHTAQGIPDTGFHRRRHTFSDQVSYLWGGPGWSAGCWRACGKPRLYVFFNFGHVFRMYLWYMVGPSAGLAPSGVLRSVILVFGWGDLEGLLLVAIGLECGLDMSDLSIFLPRFGDHAVRSVNEC